MEKIYMSKNTFNKIMIVILIICAGAIWWFWNEEQEETIWEETSNASSVDQINTDVSLDGVLEYEDIEKEDKTERELFEQKKEEESRIMCGVHVTGAVKVPDQILYLPEGTRVGEAISAAGGAAEEADLSQLNLADYIYDGQKIYVPVLGEKIINIENTQGENGENLLTNINLATKIELLNLPGIGETYAERIIQHREENGPFETIEDIMEVKGIGESKFNDLKDKITVE